MFVSAEKEGSVWKLRNRFGHVLELPSHNSLSGCRVSIGVLGTRRRNDGLQKVTELMGKMFAALDQPLYLIDVRRNGTGAQSTWSPREFGTIIPTFLPADAKYAYLHVPALAPSIKLLGSPTSRWQEFQRAYLDELSAADIDIGQAFVESAAFVGGMAVFLCAEADWPKFESLPQEAQNEHYCHRFTLAKQIALRLKAAYRNVDVQMVHLDVEEFHLQGNLYTPRLTAPCNSRD